MTLHQEKSDPLDIAYIIQLLYMFYPVSKELSEEIYQHTFSLNIKQGEYILKQGEVCTNIYFIREGAMMAHTDYNEKQIITYLSIENEFVSSLSGLYGQGPSREAIVAIEPTALLAIDTDILQGWYKRFFELNFIIRNILENYYRNAQERSFIVRTGSAEERYNYFLRSHSNAAERLPVAYVAAFLDMKPETLIRIKKKTKKDSGIDVPQIIKLIDDYVTDKKPFTDRFLKAAGLGKALNVPGYKISRSIKEHYKIDFNHYINKHRIVYFKKKISKQTNLQNFTIEALALQAGFNSRSGFYKAFKKIERTSPKEYNASLFIEQITM